MTRRRIATVVTVGVLILIALPLVYWLVPVPVSDRGLTNSVERETESNELFESDCAELRDGRWLCEVYDASASGQSTYAVDAGWSCWTARRVEDNAEIPMPARADGCTTIRDTLGLFDRALGLLD